MQKFLKENWFILAFIVVIVVVRLFILTPVKVSGHSMDPTLSDGQRLIASKISSYQRQDVIICVEPDDTSKIAVKRLIGLPGDKIEMKNDVLTINGKEYHEEYLEDFKKQFADDQLQRNIATGNYSSKSRPVQPNSLKISLLPSLRENILLWETIV